MNERDYALRDAAMAKFVDSYFKARPQIPRTQHKETLIEAGFKAAWKPAVPAPSVPDGDDFNGTTHHLILCMEALVRMDAKGVLVPHGIGRSASKLLTAAANRLRKQTAPSVPDGMMLVKAQDANNYCRILTLLGMEEEGDPVGAVSALLQSADHSEKSLKMVTPEPLSRVKRPGDVVIGYEWTADGSSAKELYGKPVELTGVVFPEEC